jgi:hypothetical protein
MPHARTVAVSAVLGSLAAVARLVAGTTPALAGLLPDLGVPIPQEVGCSPISVLPVGSQVAGQCKALVGSAP